MIYLTVGSFDGIDGGLVANKLKITLNTSSTCKEHQVELVILC